MKQLAFVVISTLLSLTVQASWQLEKTPDLQYWSYTPKHNSVRAPVMIVLHGCAQTHTDLKELGNFEDAAERFGFYVLLPLVPGGGVMMGCWDYYGKAHTEKSRHNAVLIHLAETWRNHSGIDAEKIWIAGLSSGSAQAFTTACLRPDIFRGLGLVAGPLLGTEASEISRPRTTAEAAAKHCQDLAGSRAADLPRMRVSIIRGDRDFVVALAHSAETVKTWQILQGPGQERAIDLSLFPGANTRGQGRVFLNTSGQETLSDIVNTGLDHAWPAGGGEPDAREFSITRVQRFVNSMSLNYSAYLADFFAR